MSVIAVCYQIFKLIIRIVAEKVLQRNCFGNVELPHTRQWCNVDVYQISANYPFSLNYCQFYTYTAYGSTVCCSSIMLGSNVW